MSSNYVLTTTVRFDTLLSKQPVLFPTPPSVRKPVHKDTLSVSTPTPTTSCERTNKRPVLVRTVFPKVCDVLSERMSEPLLVFDEVSESSQSTAMQPTTSLRRMLSARQV